MADKVLLSEDSLQNMADAIREKLATEDTYKPREMADAIRSIPQPDISGKMDKEVYDANNDGVVDDSEALGGYDASEYLRKATYDTNDNGIVDNAEAVNGHTVAKDVPADAKFTDTVYDDTALSSRVTSAEGSITSLQTAVASKANQSDLTALGARMASAEDDLSHLPEPAASDGVFVVTQNNRNMELTKFGNGSDSASLHLGFYLDSDGDVCQS